MDATISEMKQRQASGQGGYVLLDVREPHERDEFNIGGEHIPVGELPSRVHELQGHKDNELVVYCRSGRRSAMACDLLRQAGFSNVRNLEGGMMAWQEL